MLVDDDTVYVVSTNDQHNFVVDAFDAANGDPRWHKTPVVGVANPSTDTGRDFFQPVIVSDNLVLRGVLGNYVALNTSTGSVAWSQTAVGTNPTSAETTGSMAADDGTLFANDERGGLVSINGATGAVSCAGHGMRHRDRGRRRRSRVPERDLRRRRPSFGFAGP